MDSGMKWSGKIEAQTKVSVKFITDNINFTIMTEVCGTGVTKSEIVSNLGKTDESATEAYREARSAGGDISMIGQCGDGFDSTYFWLRARFAWSARTTMMNSILRSWRWEEGPIRVLGGASIEGFRQEAL